MKEDRRIIFEYDEVYKAIFSLCTVKEMKRPPAGNVQNITGKDNDETTIIMMVKASDDKIGVVSLEYTHDFIAAALLSFCRGMGVPIPKRARKSIVLAQNSVTMRVEI